MTTRYPLLVCVLLMAIAISLTACPRREASQPEVSSPAPSAPQTSSVAGKPLDLPFPRLGMWWPDPFEQPLAEIARYDWVILGDVPEFIPPLRALNPDILLLTSINACEVNFPLEAQGVALEDDWVRQVPPEWFLTQVGTTLTKGVGSAEETFHVTDLTLAAGDATYDLLVAGDAILIGSEIARVREINTRDKTVTVQRGYVRPAEPHPAGARVAALITFWPGSWLMDISTYCPVRIMDPAEGPETWGAALARHGAQLVHRANWDGLLIDRSDKNQSWLIGNSTARTIDPDRSNRLVSDYQAFDAAWNQGLRNFQADLRKHLGEEKIIFVNWGMENYDLLNGSNFEGFPQDPQHVAAQEVDFSRYWRETVFGPGPLGSYMDWLAQARRPNLTMIETYQDDDAPDPWGGLDYANPGASSDFMPNYRKMRLGLATALLGDGFYSFEIGTNGHGSLGLLWFDEYDNAGAGRGYLGLPLGPAQQVAQELATPDILPDGTFEAGMGSWDVWWDEDGHHVEHTIVTDLGPQGDSALKVAVHQTDGVDWKVSLTLAPLIVANQVEYTLSFWARSDSSGPITALVQQQADPWAEYLNFGTIDLTPEWRHYQVSATGRGETRQGRLHLGLGARTGSLAFDRIRLQQGIREVWRRDFQGGVALVNATASPQSVDLGDDFVKIKGTQCPQINDGGPVRRVTLPPHDGLVLLRRK